MPVQHVSSMDDYRNLLETSKSKLVVIDFSADWCGPCKFIGPVFVKLSDEMTDVVFAKVDVDECEDVGAACSIQALPTFQFYRNGNMIDEMKGADQGRLMTLLNKHK